MAWRPLLDGPRAERALDIVRGIGESSRAIPDDATGTLYGGLGGTALLHGYLAQLDPDRGHDQVVSEHLEQAIGRLGDPIQVGVAWGVAGMTWLTDHLARLGLPVEVDDSLDEFLEIAVAETPWENPFDLFDGLAGIALAVFSRASSQRPQRILQHVLSRFEEIAKPARRGLTMTYTHPLARGHKTVEPTLVGPSHGITGVTAVLARYVELDLERARANRLLDAIVESVLDHRRPAGSSTTFHAILEEELRPLRKNGMGWCHGDPGIATALLATARRANVAPLEAIASDTLRACVRRSERLLATEHVGLCHGLVGLAHMFHRAGLALDDEPLRALAIDLYTLVLERWNQSKDSLPLLEGKIGVALGLLAAATTIEPRWDEVFLMS